MIIRTSLILTLALPLMAQVDGQETAGVASFYQAYYLDKGEAKNKKSTAKAIELYTAFVAANKDHKLAGRAAANCVVLIYASGEVTKAEAFGTKYGDLMAKAEEADASSAGTSMFAGFGRGRRGGGGGGGGGQENENQDMIDKLMALHENAEGNLKTRLTGAITRLGGARALMMARFGGGRGGFGGGRGGGGRGGFGGRSRGITKPNIAEMSKEDAQKAVETLVTNAERLVDSMASRGQADKADELEAQLDKVQDLVDDGKLKEAQKIIDGLDLGSSGRGGNQGGRRRRGGDAGGAGDGERRRRRGGDAGDAGGTTGERRRRG